MIERTPEPVHILVLMTATSPWRLHGRRWMRQFRNDDTGHLFLLVGPRVRARAS